VKQYSATPNLYKQIVKQSKHNLRSTFTNFLSLIYSLYNSSHTLSASSCVRGHFYTSGPLALVPSPDSNSGGGRATRGLGRCHPSEVLMRSKLGPGFTEVGRQTSARAA
jgi:hypothetical protein